MLRSQARIIAFKAIFAYVSNSEDYDIESAIDLARKDEALDVDSHDYINFVVSSTINNFEQLKNMIDSHSGEFVYSRIYKVDLALLYLALAEMLYLKTPIKVAINEVINIAKEFSTEDSPKYLNGVLGSIVKDLGLN